MEEKSLVDKLNFLYQQGNIFVMDNHLAAGWCWYNILERGKEYNFCHIDQHNDLANDNHELVKSLFSKEEKVSLTEYLSLHRELPSPMVTPL